ncbi:MAG: beta-ketoacyl synthase N-terminal-like domain-containing protein [Bacteroidota bacterium]
MNKVFIESNNIISSLGFTTEENLNNVLAEKSGIKICDDLNLSKTPFPASHINNHQLEEQLSFLENRNKYTRFEKVCILSIKKTLENSSINISDKKTLLILSTTKGNIELLDNELKSKFDEERSTLWKTADIIANYFNAANTPLVISNACISGVSAMIVGKRLINSGQYNNVIIVGADLLTKFVISGFQSFMSLSPTPCKPFDAHRDGLSLGEGAATIILTNNEQAINGCKIEIVEGSTNNDANHISGPSRTGEGLLLAIKKTINNRTNIDFISAHGTATPFNDDMESVAISRAGLEFTPVNSLKGFFGHTLGAAGVIETIISIEALKRNMLIKTIGYNEYGVVGNITISDKTEKKEYKTLLKVASGFGGCNAAALFEKHD